MLRRGGPPCYDDTVAHRSVGIGSPVVRLRGAGQLCSLRAAAVFLASALCAQGALAETVGLLPTSGSAAIDDRAQLDVAIRKALAKLPEFTVQPAKDTGAAMSTLIDLNGEVCENEDVACLAKLCILADVQTLIVTEASGKRTLEVKLTIIDVEDGKLRRTVEGDVRQGDNGDAEALLERAFKGQDSVVRIIDKTPQKPKETDDGPTFIAGGDGPIDETKLTDMQFAGATIAGVGGGLSGLGLLGALTCEAIFWTGTGPAATRKNVVAPLGSALWVGAAVGAVAAGVGGGVFLAGAPDSGKKTLSE